MKIIENYKVIFQDEKGDYSPLDHFIYLDKNAERIGEFVIERLTNNRNVIYKLNDTYFLVRTEDISAEESLVHWVYQVTN